MSKKLHIQPKEPTDEKDLYIAKLEAALAEKEIQLLKRETLIPIPFEEIISRLRAEFIVEGMLLATNSPLQRAATEYFNILAGIHVAVFCENGPATRATLENVLKELVGAAHNLQVELEKMGAHELEASTQVFLYFERLRNAVKKYIVAGKQKRFETLTQEEREAHFAGTTQLLKDLRELVGSATSGMNELNTTISAINNRGRRQLKANELFCEMLAQYPKPPHGAAYQMAFKIYSELRNIPSALRSEGTPGS